MCNTNPNDKSVEIKTRARRVFPAKLFTRKFKTCDITTQMFVYFFCYYDGVKTECITKPTSGLKPFTKYNTIVILLV